MPPGTDNLWPECAGPLKVRHGHASGLQRRRQVCTLHWAVLSDEFGNRLWVVAHLASVKAVHPGVWPWFVHLLVFRPGALQQHGAAFVRGLSWQGTPWQPHLACKSPACLSAAHLEAVL